MKTNPHKTETKAFVPIANTHIGEEEAQAVYNVVKSGWISMGKKVEEFEKMAAEYAGVKYAVAFNNGTASLHAGLISLGIKTGDEVIVPTLSYISSANVILYCGASPQFCEADRKTFTITAEEVEKRITPRTKAIISVDLKGMPVDFDAISEVADRHSIQILSDSAESFGAIYKGRIVGSHCKLHSFSFFANKNITMGEGGLITTNDPNIADICRKVRNQGQSERYKHVIVGNNYRPTDILAALGIEQLKRIEWILDEKNKIATYYNEAFAGNPLIATPYVPPYVGRHSWYMYCLKLDKAVNRDTVVAKLTAEHIDTRLSFPPIHLQPVYQEKYGYKEGDFPVSEEIFDAFVDIPCWAGMSRAHVDRVVGTVKRTVEDSKK